MQWTAGENAGFSGTPWLKLNPRHRNQRRGAEPQPGLVFYHQVTLISLRREHRPDRRVPPLDEEDEQVYACA